MALNRKFAWTWKKGDNIIKSKTPRKVSKHQASKKGFNHHNHQLSLGESKTSQLIGLWVNHRQYQIQKNKIEFENLPDYSNGESDENLGVTGIEAD